MCNIQNGHGTKNEPPKVLKTMPFLESRKAPKPFVSLVFSLESAPPKGTKKWSKMNQKGTCNLSHSNHCNMRAAGPARPSGQLPEEIKIKIKDENKNENKISPPGRAGGLNIKYLIL